MNLIYGYTINALLFITNERQILFKNLNFNYIGIYKVFLNIH